MMKNKENKRKRQKNVKKCSSRNKGITLIALVITIIVLLILAGVTIATLTGENGIITKATQAKDKTEISAEKEQITVAYGGALAKKNGQTDINASDMQDQFDKNDTNAEASGAIKVYFPDSKRWYKVDGNGNVTGPFASEDEMGTTLAEAIESGEIKIGDYVHFENPTSGKAEVDADALGLERTDVGINNGDNKQVYEITEEKNQLNWRVLGVEDGKVKLIAGSPLKSNNTINGNEAPYLFMYGAKSYTQGPTELTKICSTLYPKSSLIYEARSVNMDDINAITGITDENKIKEVNLDPHYGGKQYKDTYNFTDQYTPESWLNGKTKTTVSGTVDGYYYAINSEDEEVTATVSDSRLYDMLFKNVEYPNGAQYWLASRDVSADSSYAIFGPGLVFTDSGITSAGTVNLFGSDGSGRDNFAAVRPVDSINCGYAINGCMRDNIETNYCPFAYGDKLKIDGFIC